MYGLTQVVISKESAEAYNPKVIRSTMGAIFRVNIIESESLKDTIKELKKHKYKVYGASLDASKSIYDIEYKKTGIVIGNEANGISKIVKDVSDELVKIPMLR